MHETHDQTQPAEQQPEPAVWQPPALTTVDTALEVTAYSLNSR
ncbi:pyrroloquinoline quinone precursor peptide PqqA [Streptomyces sp. NPDC001595]